MPFGTRTALGLAAAGLMASSTLASTTVVWNFDVETMGEDEFWMSMDAVKTTAGAYDWTFEITLLEVDVFFITTIGPIDVTDMVPPEMLVTGGSTGPLPAIIDQGPVVAPAPPEDPAVAFDLTVSIDENGFGNVAGTNVVLGTAEVDLGIPFGVQTVDITRVRMAGDITVTPVCVGDLDGCGVVNAADLASLLGFWGTSEPLADLDGSGTVGAADLAMLLGFWGPCFQ